MTSEKPIHVLFIPAHFHPLLSGYGAAAVHFLQASAVHVPEISYTVLTTEALNTQPELTLSQSTIVRIRVPSLLPGYLQLLVREIILFWRIRGFCQRKHTDIIFFETMERTLCLWLLSYSSLQHKLVIRIHGTTEMESFRFGTSPQHRVRNFLARKALKRISHILATTPAYIKFCKQHFFDRNVLAYADKLFGVVSNTVPPPQNTEHTSSIILNPLGITRDRFFLSVGRMDREGCTQKGFVDLIAAASLAFQKSPEIMGLFHFVLIGDGSERVRLQHLIHKVGMAHLFTIVPSLANEEVRTLAQYARAAVFPSRFEGIAIFALECLSAGTPLVFSDAGGNADVVRDSYNGYIVPPQDILGLAKALLSMAQTPAEEVREFRIHSQAHFEQNFSGKAVMARWQEYAKLIKAQYYA